MTHISFSVTSLFKVHTCKKMFVFLLFNLESSLCSLDTIPCWVYDLRTFAFSVDCLFLLLTMSTTDRKILLLIVILSVFDSVGFVFSVMSKNSLPNSKLRKILF